MLLLDCLGFEVGFAIHLSKRVNRCLIALRFACERTRSFITPLDAERSAKDANGADYGGVVYEASGPVPIFSFEIAARSSVVVKIYHCKALMPAALSYCVEKRVSGTLVWLLRSDQS
ncbi:hypothetical protein X741_23870 [Mesorhizobium sp. LNHC229A00]|nr:hypothetical protein X741_23870 [Mesorhizobium sp. LNHC229A00]